MVTSAKSFFSDSMISDLTDSIDWSQRQLTFPRRERVQSIRQFIGSNHVEGGPVKKVPVNFLKLAVDIYVRQLAARSPRVLVSTLHPELKHVAANLSLAVNEIPEEIGLTKTLRRFVTEALFSIGILKCGIYTTQNILGEDYGETFVDDITIDDWFCDMSAKRMDLIQYCGNDYWPVYEEVMESNEISKSVKSRLFADEHTWVNELGEERAESISSTETATEYKKRIHMRDVWLPDERVMMTYAVTSKAHVRDFKWEGPDNGPYHILGYTEVPGNLLPLASVPTWRDLHELANALFRKLGNQGDGQKSVLGFSNADDEEIENFRKASDGDGIKYTGAPPVPLTVGGVSQSTLAFYLQVRDLYSYFSGNLDSLGGLSAATETVGQDKLLSEAASAQMRDMAARTVDATKGLFTSLAWYEWNDPLKTRILEKPIPGTDISIPVDWNQEAKVGGFDLYDLDIDVYSLQDDSPSLKLQKLNIIVERYILPLMPAILQAGGVPNVQEILLEVAKLSDYPEAGAFITWPDQSQAVASGLPKGNTPGRKANADGGTFGGNQGGRSETNKFITKVSAKDAVA